MQRRGSAEPIPAATALPEPMPGGLPGVSPAPAADASHMADTRTEASFFRRNLLLLGLGFALLIGAAASNVVLLHNSSQQQAAVERNIQLRGATASLLDTLQDAESAQRGYLLTLDEAYLAPYEASQRALEGRLETFRLNVQRAMPELGHQPALDEVPRLAHAKMDELASTLALAQSGKMAEARAVVLGGEGQTLMLDLRAALDRLQVTSAEDLRNSRILAAQAAERLQWALLGSLLLIALLGLASFLLARRYGQSLAAAHRAVLGANQELEGEVSVRTGDLLRANEEIQRFAYIVSHDLRAPLVNVMGFTSELEESLRVLRSGLGLPGPSDLSEPLGQVERGQAAVGEAGYAEGSGTDTAPDAAMLAQMRAVVADDIPEALGFIRSSTGRMDRLIAAILQISREGRRVMRPEPLQMRRLIEGLAASQQHRLDDAGASITFAAMPDLVADRLAVEQIFGNLLDNAIKYLDPARPGQIAVRGAPHGTHVVYEVVDNGRGIADADRERVFELFRRAGRQDTAGEGIGLAHVRAQARKLGGDVLMQSTLGEGSIFRVVLPMLPRDETRVALGRRASDRTRDGAHDRAGERPSGHGSVTETTVPQRTTAAASTHADAASATIPSENRH